MEKSGSAEILAYTFPMRVRTLLLILALIGGGWSTLSVHAGLNIESRFSPLNRKRAPRSSTEFIILHTTEGGAKGSLEKLRKYGEAHYMVDTKGKVTRIISRDRIAYHCGRSMWNGRTNLDNHSIGIEIVGYHNKPLTSAQITAIRELIRQLQAIYSVPDNKVIPHSMVAYGRPNRWHKFNHRGRKRCAMYLARDDVRRQLGLTSKPRTDPDVKAGRLKVADPYLAKVLYTVVRTPSPVANQTAANVIARGRSAWDIARENYNAATTTYVFPDGTRRQGNTITDWNRMPAGTKVVVGTLAGSQRSPLESVQRIGQDGASAAEIAGSAIALDTTFYFLQDGTVVKGSDLDAARLLSLPKGTGMLVGYVNGGQIRSNRRAFDICGPRWNLPTTFYRLPDGTIRNGAEMDERGIPNGTMVYFQP